MSWLSSVRKRNLFSSRLLSSLLFVRLPLSFLISSLPFFSRFSIPFLSSVSLPIFSRTMHCSRVCRIHAVFVVTGMTMYWSEVMEFSCSTCRLVRGHSYSGSTASDRLLEFTARDGASPEGASDVSSARRWRQVRQHSCQPDTVSSQPGRSGCFQQDHQSQFWQFRERVGVALKKLIERAKKRVVLAEEHILWAQDWKVEKDLSEAEERPARLRLESGPRSQFPTQQRRCNVHNSSLYRRKLIHQQGCTTSVMAGSAAKRPLRQRWPGCRAWWSMQRLPPVHTSVVAQFVPEPQFFPGQSEPR